MPRSVPEWIGAKPDTPVPTRVRTRVFCAKGGGCHKCTRKVLVGEPWTCEHLKAIINGGENRESNLGVTCKNCLPAKNAADVREKSVIARKRAKHLGLHKSSKPLPFGRKSKWKKKVDGSVVER